MIFVWVWFGWKKVIFCMVGLIIGGIFFWGRCVILKVVLMLLNRCFYFWILKVIGLRMIGCLLLNNWKRKRFFWSVWLMG